MGRSKPVDIKQFQSVTVNNELFLKASWGLHIAVDSFGDTWQDKVYNRPTYQLKSFIKNALRRQRKLTELLWCFDQFSTGGYYHWVTEIAPRLWVASKHVDPSVPLLIPGYFLERWPFAMDFLRPFGRELIPFGERELVCVEKMHFISATGGPFNFLPEPIHQSTRLLRDTYLGSDCKSGNRRVYISRERSGKRTVLNEAEVIPLVQRYGFEVIHTEELSVPEQVRLFSQTSHLLSIHGAGLSNLVFMPPKSHVVEIRHRDDNPMLNCFFCLAHTFDQTYSFVFGDARGDGLPTEHRPEDKSIYADLGMLEATLESLNLGER